MNVEKNNTDGQKVTKSEFHDLQKCFTKERILVFIICLASLLLMLTLIACYKTSIPTCETNYKVSPNTDHKRSTNISLYSSYCTCNEKDNIECLEVPSLDVLENEIDDLAECVAKRLIINDPKIKTIPAFFLQNSLIQFKELDIIGNSYLVDIEEDAFNTETFRSLTRLTFERSFIEQLRKRSFFGLGGLETFEYRMYSKTHVIFEENFFEYMPELEVLQFNGINLTTESFQNTTASNTYLYNLKNVDFSSDRIQTLDEDVFKSFVNVKLFHLHFSEVTYIHVNTFRGMNCLETLYLKNNRLTTLPDGVFNINLGTLRVYLEENFWQCYCNLKWLQTLVLETETIADGLLLRCTSHKSVKFEEVVFCEETTTIEPTTTTVTTSTTESSTTEMLTSALILSTLDDTDHSEEYRKILCRDWAASPINMTRSDSADVVHTQYLYTKYENFVFLFFDPDEDPVWLQVEITGNVTGFHFLFFDSFNTDDTECITNMSNTIILNTLQRSHTYTYCMIYRDETTVAPKDCFGFEVRVSYDDRAWITNRLSKIITVFSIITIIFAIILGALLMYICVRKHPVLIKGNKRVIIIGKKKPEEPMTPKEYEKPVYTPPSLDSMLSSATQSQYGYTKIKRRRYKSPMLRSVSESSEFNNEISYISPVGPSSYQLNTWRVNSRIGQPDIDTFEESIYHQAYPPPLPPPNHIKYLPREENLYTTL